MTRFSERAGYRPAKTAIQLESIDAELQGALWSAYHDAYVKTEMGETTRGATHASFYRGLWREFFKQPIDTMPWNPREFTKVVRKWFFEASWFEVYDFVEFVAQNGRSHVHGGFLREVNRVLEREVAAYRLVEGQIVRITEPLEVNAIDGAIGATEGRALEGAHVHLRTALEMLADRKAPDYRNSIKESISAVESIAKVLSEDRSADLAKALRALEKRTPLHGALRAGFLSLYGFTSDAGGIRHALLEAPHVDFADAKYMLVTCSAFVTFLIARARDAGIPVE